MTGLNIRSLWNQRKKIWGGLKMTEKTISITENELNIIDELCKTNSKYKASQNIDILEKIVANLKNRLK
mgnify:FL=1